MSESHEGWVFDDADRLIAESLAILRPRKKLDLVEFGDKNVGHWNKDLAHLLHEPARSLTSRRYTQVIYCGPSRTSKSLTLIDVFMAYTAMVDPVDMAVFFPVENIASYFSKKRFGIELCSNVEGLRDMIRSGPTNDNVYMKIFKDGNILNFGWMSKSQAASRDYVRVGCSDLDRVSGDVGGEGSFFQLVANRIETYLSRGMAFAESSPGKPITDPEWVQRTPHEAPPTSGILGLYNHGTRRLVYSQCPHCKEYFSPAAGPEAIHIPEAVALSNSQRSAAAAMICTSSGCEIDQTHERAFKRSGVWVGEGQEVDNDGVVHGELIDTYRDSFWQSGWHAAFRTWKKQCERLLEAQQKFEQTGDEGDLKTVYNTGLAAPYLEASRRIDKGVLNQVKARAEDYEKFTVPEGVRVLLAGVDVQGGENSRFIVQVHGYGEFGERWLIDRYSISMTADEEGQRQIRPASNLSDWNYITEKVVNSTYKLSNGDELRVYRTAVDTGGEAGATERSYEWWRSLKSSGLHKRVRMVKGGSAKSAPMIKIIYPDSSEAKDRFGGGKGDIPVLLLNTDLLKDAVWSSLVTEEAGRNYWHFPKWIDDWFYKELAAEVRGVKGWTQVAKRNEAVDLAAYIHAIWIELKGHRVKWETPYAWCQEMDTNSEVMSKGERVSMKERKITTSRRTRFKFNR